jgi:hypothetical protein
MLKEHFGEEIVETHCVRHFIMLMIAKKLMQQLLKLCDILLS